MHSFYIFHSYFLNMSLNIHENEIYIRYVIWFEIIFNYANSIEFRWECEIIINARGISGGSCDGDIKTFTSFRHPVLVNRSLNRSLTHTISPSPSPSVREWKIHKSVALLNSFHYFELQGFHIYFTELHLISCVRPLTQI